MNAYKGEQPEVSLNTGNWLFHASYKKTFLETCTFRVFVIFFSYLDVEPPIAVTSFLRILMHVGT